jgi:hypothetical protein
VRRLVGASAAALALLLLAGCALGPDPTLIRGGAQRVFDRVVAQLSAADSSVVRTVSVAEPVDEACSDDVERTRTTLTATATLSVTADATAWDAVTDEVADALDARVWDVIRPDAAVPGQRAWASLDGVVVTVTPQGSALVAAVFTPC